VISLGKFQSSIILPLRIHARSPFRSLARILIRRNNEKIYMNDSEREIHLIRAHKIVIKLSFGISENL